MLEGISSTQKIVLISLADQANDDGVCWPSVRTIEKRTCLSERAVRSSVRQLEELGILKRNERAGRSTYYIINTSKIYPCTTCTPAPSAPPPLHQVHPTPAPGAPITIIEPSNEPSDIKPKKYDKPKTEYNSQDLISVGVEESVARDFLINRKKQKAPLTETALRGIVREAEKAGLTLAQAIQITTERGWRSFKAEYVMNKQSGQYITFYELATGRKPEF